jgi:Lysyl oxidase
MEATQRLKVVRGRSIVRRHAGTLRYAVAPDHSHWHYLRAMSYELTTPGGKRVGRDRKTGFCLGDRYETDEEKDLPGEPSTGVWVGRCGLNRPDLRAVKEGISVGYSDNYLPALEGQYIDITGLRPGRYVLVHRVNPDRHLREETYANNAASVLLAIDGSGAPPRILEKCPASARCRP